MVLPTLSHASCTLCTCLGSCTCHCVVHQRVAQRHPTLAQGLHAFITHCMQQDQQRAIVCKISSCIIGWRPGEPLMICLMRRDHSSSYQVGCSSGLPSGSLAWSSLRLPCAALAQLAGARQLVPTQPACPGLVASSIRWHVECAPLSHRLLCARNSQHHAWLQGWAQQPRSPSLCRCPTW